MIDQLKKELLAMIYFVKANITHIDTIFEWLAEPHMMEFWDNTSQHIEAVCHRPEYTPRRDSQLIRA